MPKIVNTAITMSSRKPKVMMFGRVLIILYKSNLNEVQFLASLNILKSLMLLNTITPLPILTPLTENITLSTILNITISASKRLKLSLAY